MKRKLKLPKGYKLGKEYKQYRKKFQSLKKSRGFVKRGERMLGPKQFESLVGDLQKAGAESSPTSVAKSQVGEASQRSWKAYRRQYQRYSEILARRGDSMKSVELTREQFDYQYSQYKALVEAGESIPIAKTIAQDQAYLRSWKQARALKNAIMVAAITEVEEMGMEGDEATDFLTETYDAIPSAMDIMMGKEEDYLESNDLLWDAIRDFRAKKLAENPNYDRALLAEEVKNNFFYMKQASAK